MRLGCARRALKLTYVDPRQCRAGSALPTGGPRARSAWGRLIIRPCCPPVIRLPFPPAVRMTGAAAARGRHALHRDCRRRSPGPEGGIPDRLVSA